MATDLGVDISANVNGDLDPMMVPISGTASNQVLAEAVLRRLQTEHGSLFYDQNYGEDIRNFIGEALDTNGAYLLQSAIETQACLDERVTQATALVSFGSIANTLTIHLTVTGANGPFVMVLAVNALSVSLLKAG